MRSLLDFLIRNQFLLLVGSAASVLLLLAAGFVIVYVVSKRATVLGRDLPSGAPMPSPPRRIVSVGLIIPILLIVLGYLEPIPKTVVLVCPELSRDSPTNTKLLVFVHGWKGDPAETWQMFPQLVQEDQAFDSFNVLAIGYPTFLTRRNLNVKPMARWLDDCFERKGFYRRYEGIWIIAHSMGGLIARELLIANRMHRNDEPYKFLIEIASPHQGASVAGLAKALGVSRGLVDDLTPGSPFLSNLREDWNGLILRPSTFCLTSPHDAIVSEESAIAQCDRYLRYPQWGHIDMVKPSDRKDERYAVPMSRVKP